MTLPQKVTLYEVGPRDGLQNERQAIAAETKVALVDALSAAGLPVVEAASFVSPKWVPQMADAAAVMAAIDRRDGTRYAALTPNEKGAQAALAAGCDIWAVFAAASEAFSQRNINCSIAESLRRFEPVMALAADHGVPVRGYVSCVLGCPYEGDIAPAKVAQVAAALAAMGCYEISLGDTIGVGTPGRMQALIDAVGAKLPLAKLAVHCHDTYGQALANIHAALGQGIATVDAAVAGLGGCPYAEGASGNVATEDVLYMLDGLGIETGVDLAKIVDAAWFIAGALGGAPRSKVAQALRPPSQACAAGPAGP
ncbi:MAG: hydroxymethylglutaryl-CoA lyase [Sphingomonadales bacterium]